MIDRTQLTEALDLHKNALPALALVVDASVFDHYSAIALRLEEAARLLLDFPTDEQVEAAGKACMEPDAVLEAVRRVMFGEQDAQVETG